MTRKLAVRAIDVAVLATLAYFAVYKPMTRSRTMDGPRPFHAQVELEPLRTLAVHTDGRVKSFDSYARTMIRYIAGPYGLSGQDPAFTYLDLMFGGDRYIKDNIRTIFVKKQIRPHLARVMESIGEDQYAVNHFLERGMISPMMIRTPAMIDELVKLDADVIRTSKFVTAIQNAVLLSDPQELAARLRIIPPPDGDDKTRWFAGPTLWGFSFLHPGHADQASDDGSIPGLTQEMASKLTSTWNRLAAAWQAEDAEAVNTAAVDLAAALRSVNPDLYPQLDKLELESWYFRWHAFTWNWIVYILAAVPLLISVIYRWRWAYSLGVAILLVAFAIHTVSLGVRWYISGRIPNANMFEAVSAATWLGVVGAFILEFLTRKTVLRGLFFLAAAVAAMVAIMCQHFLPASLSSDIDNVMPVLDDVWLYIHTNVIIWSYVLIAGAAVTGLLYLRHRAGGGDPRVAKAGGAGSLILSDAPGSKNSFIREESVTMGMIYDAATMVQMELAFIMLWAGLVMGAIWADHSWGRPWGWDPKEVFALCTFLVFLILVHVRFKVRDKGFWTAGLAVVGCGVMLFNWIVINFKISGLHSYA